MLHATWNRMLHNKGRLVLTVVAVALGVTFLTGSFVLTDSTHAALRDSYAQVYAGVDVVVRGPENVNAGPIGAGSTIVPAAALGEVRSVPGVAAAEGRIRGPAQLLTGDAPGAPAIAMAVPADPASASVAVRSGRLPAAAQEVAVDAVAARDLDLTVGDGVQVLLPGGTVDGEVVGTVGFGWLDALAGGARVLLHAATAGALIGDRAYAEIAVDGQEGVADGELRDRVAAALGDDARVVTAVEAASSDAAVATRAAGSVSGIVLAVAVIALLVGGFLIANTFRMLVGQRARELALLRAVGASRRQVAVSVLLESAATGLIGSIAGVAAGLGAGALLIETSAGLLPGLPPVPPTITATPLLVGPAVGVGLAVVAARGAVRRALAIPPVAAMRAAAMADPEPARLRLVAGGLLLAAGVAGALVGVQAGQSLLIAAASGAALLAAGLLFPLITGPVLSVLSRPVGRLSITGALARQQILAAPRRTGATAGALAVSLALITFLLTFSASLGAAAPTLVTSRQHAEFTIRSTAQQGLHDFLFEAAEAADELDEVAAARVVTYGEFRMTGSDGSSNGAFYAVDPSVAASLFDVHDRQGSVAAVTGDAVAVRDRLARAEGWSLGDRVTLTFGDGDRVDFTVAATFDGAITTDWILAPDAVAPYLRAADRQAFVKLEDGVTPAQVRSAVERALEPFPAAELLEREQQQAEIADANDNAIGIVTALFSLSLIVGVLGVVNTLTLAVVERVRELGLLRAVGTTRRQIRAMIRWEAALTAVLGAVVGVGLGLALSWVGAQVLTEQLSVPLTVPVTQIAGAIAATVALGMLSSVLPAARAARVDVLHALQAG
jgi:putative ABC transport system permease protein